MLLLLRPPSPDLKRKKKKKKKRYTQARRRMDVRVQAGLANNKFLTPIRASRVLWFEESILK